MQRLAGREVFSVADRRYLWDDVVLAAHLWGDMARLRSRVRGALACSKRLEERGEELTEAEIDAAADDWRYDRDLLSADDMTAWLSSRRLDTDEWFDYIASLILHRRFGAQVEEISRAHEVPESEVEAALYAEAVCSGALSDLADRLAAQAALYARVCEESGTDRPSCCTPAEVRAIIDELPEAASSGVLGIPSEQVGERAESIACLSVCYEWFIDRLAAPAAIEREIESHAMEWTRVDGRAATFPSEETAREVVLLVREDGVAFESAVETAGAKTSEKRYVVEDTDPALRDKLIGSLPGELVGPVPAEGGFVLVSVEKRYEASADDPDVRRRAGERIIRRTIQREVERRVQWHERL